MKIDNVNIDEFLKDNKMVINQKKSEELSKRKPSIKQKHIKNKKRVEKAKKDLQSTHNHSWYDEIKSRYKDHMNQAMTYYRGYEKTGTEVFSEADALADKLLSIGVEKGTEIVACMSNVPEVLTLMLAASKCGAVINFIGDKFDHEFLNEIFSSSDKKLFIGTDDIYQNIEDIVKDAGFEYKVLVSLSDSLKNGIDPFKKYDKNYFLNQKGITNNVQEYKNEDPSIISWKEFLKNEHTNGLTYPEVGIEDKFTITYTSGSTKIGWPKAIVHKNKAYIAIGRFHDPDLSRMPAMRNMRGLAHIPTHSNTNLVSSISDTLCQKCTVAFEPIYDPNFFAYSLIINKAGFVPATRSFWLEAIKKFRNNQDLKNEKLGYAINYVAVGEDISKNERQYIDKELKRLEAGSDKLPKPLSPITLSVGGGNCEHGGLFFTLFKSLREKTSLRPSTHKDYGLVPFQLANLAVLHEDGTECNYNEVGNLVADSMCTMKEYKNNKQATDEFFIKDAYGRKWGNCNIYAYVENNGNVVFKGRKDSNLELSTGKKIPNFLINDTILEGEKDLLSCEVVTVKNDYNQEVAVAHIQFRPEYECSYNKMMQKVISIDNACKDKFSPELSKKLVYQIHTDKKPFPLTKSGKRSIRDLEKDGLEYSIKPYKLFSDEKPEILDSKFYFETLQNQSEKSKTKQMKKK